MYHHLATRFGRNSHQISGREALDNEALRRHVPSVVARYGEEESPVRPDQIIAPRRREDVGQNLWQTFNVIQENLIRGGLDGRRQTSDGRIRRSRTRPINGIDQNVGLNRALWTLAEGMQRLKSA